MKTQITKTYIEENLLNKRNGLNPNKTKLIKETPEELYLIYHNIEPRKCKCGNNTTFLRFTTGYTEYCSLRCSANSSKTKGKKKITNIERYGVENPSQSKKIQEKKKATNIERYGVEYPFQSEEIREKSKTSKLEKYGDENYNNRDKAKATNIENYGYENYAQTGQNTNSYKHKDYTYPSGKVVKIQGYENLLLDELLETYTENEILTDKKDMPEFWYITEDGKKHRYFPDIYIPKDNTIYEVKSSYTLEQSMKDGIFELKEQSVSNTSFIFELKVY